MKINAIRSKILLINIVNHLKESNFINHDFFIYNLLGNEHDEGTIQNMYLNVQILLILSVMIMS